jgi:hypothetical protein
MPQKLLLGGNLCIDNFLAYPFVDIFAILTVMLFCIWDNISMIRGRKVDIVIRVVTDAMLGGASMLFFLAVGLNCMSVFFFCTYAIIPLMRIIYINVINYKNINYKN